MSTTNLSPSERREVLRADTSRRLWLQGTGSVFWQNAVRNARPEQLDKVVARLEEAKRRGAAPAGSVN